MKWQFLTKQPNPCGYCLSTDRCYCRQAADEATRELEVKLAKVAAYVTLMERDDGDTLGAAGHALNLRARLANEPLTDEEVAYGKAMEGDDHD
jgi:hypothetical protein